MGGDLGVARARRIALAASALAVLVRIAFLLTPAGGLDGDEAVTGIMARNMAQGHDAYVFFLGQEYNGSLEQIPQALLFAIGLPVTPMVLRIPQLVMAGVATYLMYLVGRRVLRTEVHAVAAACAFAVGPYFLIWKGARSYGSYSAELLVVLVALLLVTSDDPGTLRWRAAGYGLCVGLTYWLTPSGYVVVIPAGVWLLARARRDGRALLAAVAGTVAGLAPVLYWVARYRAVPVPNPDHRHTTAWDRLGNLFDPVGREFIGVAFINGAPGWPIWLGRITLWALVLAAVIALVRRRRGLLGLLTLRTGSAQPFDLVLLCLPLTVVAYAASEFAWFATEPRYLHVAYPVLLLALVGLVPKPAGPTRRVGVALVLLFVAGPSLTLLVTRADDVPGSPGPADYEAVIDLLEGEGSTDVYAQYWTAMPLELYADDRLTVGTLIVPDRLLDERMAVDRAPDPVWVAARTVNSDDITPMRIALDRAGITYRERELGDFIVVDRFSKDVRPWEIGLGVPVEP